MFGKSVRLFRLFGFEVKADLSWIALALLITWSLSRAVFPHYVEGLPVFTYWLMGAVGAIGLFLSIIFHELFHSLVARQYGLPMKGITLFIFGGVAEMNEEPESPKVEFLMAIAGPASSVLLGLIFLVVQATGARAGWPKPMLFVLSYLSTINFVLAVFNMVPAFPLDGGRVLRAALWQWKKKLKWATHTASKMGSFFGILLIILGVTSILTGNFIGGMWWFLIGMFMRSASQMSYRQVLTREALKGEKVERFMRREPITVMPSVSIQELVEDYIYKYHFKIYPVVDNGVLVGCITSSQVKDLPREEWPHRTVGDIATQCSPDSAVSPDMEAVKVLSIMTRTGNGRLVVVEGEKLVGVITLKDLMGFLSVKLELEGEDEE